MMLFALGMLCGVLLVRWDLARARRQKSGVTVIRSRLPENYSPSAMLSEKE